MKRKMVSILMCAFIAFGSLSACGANNSESTISQSQSGSEVSLIDQSTLVTIVDKYIKNQNLDITTPDIATQKWSFMYDPDTGFYNATVTGKDAKGNNDVVSAWVELKDDNSYSIHYFDTKDGVLIDDGQVPD